MVSAVTDGTNTTNDNRDDESIGSHCEETPLLPPIALTDDDSTDDIIPEMILHSAQSVEETEGGHQNEEEIPLLCSTAPLLSITAARSLLPDQAASAATATTTATTTSPSGSSADGIPTTTSTTSTTTPLPLSWSARKRRMIMTLIGSMVMIVAVRFLIVTNRLEMPHPHAILRVIDVNAPPVQLTNGETVADIMESKKQSSKLRMAAEKMTREQEKKKQQLYSFFGKPIFRTTTSSTSSSSFSRAASVKQQQQQQQQLLQSKEKPIPLVIDKSDKMPVGVGNQKQSAAEALMCRESVINYVINATNSKDECMGLQKAFDETCSQQDDDELAEENNQQHSPDKKNPSAGRRQLTTTTTFRYHHHPAPSSTPQQHKNQTVTKETNLWQSLHDKATWGLHRVLVTLSHQRPKFYAEDAVYRVYPKSKAILWSRRQLHRKRRLQEGTTTTLQEQLIEEQQEEEQQQQLDNNKATKKSAKDDGPNDDDDLTKRNGHNSRDREEEGESPMDEVEQEPIKNERSKPEKPRNILTLPTGNLHVSEKTLEKTLLLQQEDKLISQVIKAVNATANATKTTVDAKEFAAASAKAVADTSELVSAVLNDPTSIEARACCSSILNVYHENCNVDAEEEISDKRLFIVVLVMAFCGMVKSLIRHFKIRWLPEAAGCILVGVASGYASSYFPRQDFSFDGNWFLRILVPPIVFEAALSIDKKAFNRHLVPILIYSTAGTVIAAFLTATMVYNTTKWLGSWCETIPYIESLIFGSLISSIDPVAVLSVLSNMGMTDTDTLYVLVFGESLLNDGVAIVLFHTLVQFVDVNVIIDQEAIVNAVIHFFVVALGSVLIGVGSGIMCTLYFCLFHGCQTPLVEVLMFLCWALLPYYVCDGIGWSGIVSAVTVGFVMDMYVIGLGDHDDDISEHSHGSASLGYINEPFLDERKSDRKKFRTIFSGEGHLSREARTHIHFVTEIVATMMETAIFAYLGLFLFSHRYHWNGFHVIISILSCCVSRAIMIPLMSSLANWITSMQKYQNRCRGIHHKNSPATGVIVDKKMQMILWFAGLRGAMSFALVEHIPLFDAVTGEGSRVKAELKAMTSASIMFTVFVLGGSTNYFMEYIGLSPPTNTSKKNMEMISLTSGGGLKNSDGGSSSSNSGNKATDNDLKKNGTHSSRRLDNSRQTRQRPLRGKGCSEDNSDR